jgi:catechol 2,3-dioxygenase-like lactoylglutathione lyase family enzyme
MTSSERARVSHLVLPVSNLQRSRDWYVEKLGFKLDRERDGAVGIVDRSGLTLFLIETANNLAGDKITLTIEVDDVARAHRELVALGVTFANAPGRQFWGYGAAVLDPDGYMNHLWDDATMRREHGARTD